MDFFSLIVFLALYYLRPQEWFGAFNALHPVQLLSVMAIYAMARSHRFKFKELVKTPTDWMVVAYLLWTLIPGYTPYKTFTGIEAVCLFYFVAACSLNTIPKQKKFLGWWCALMIVISALAIASQYGFDPFGSKDLTEGIMKGRLVLNLSVFNNPNALAHSVISAVPLIYFLMFWRQVVAKVGLLLMAIPLWCLFLTQSKGGFLCGFLTLLATLTFGRSKPMQVAIVIFAVVFGYGALYSLPRMNQLNKSKADPAIQGRVAAATYGLQLMRTTKIGIGLSQFQTNFFRFGPLEQTKKIKIIPERTELGANGAMRVIGSQRHVDVISQHYMKATHSAYNQNGAELGYPGLFLFVGILYCCLRTLILSKTETDDEERIRRALFALVVAYASSSWMVDFCYRPTFFMMVAAVSAFHRHLLRKQEPLAPVVEAAPIKPWIPRLAPMPMPVPMPALGLGTAVAVAELRTAAASTAVMAAPEAPAMAMAIPPGFEKVKTLSRKEKEKASFHERLAKQFVWTRLGPLDFLLMLLLTYAAILYWEHLIKSM